MSKSWNRTETWLALIALGAGLLLMAVLGVWGYERHDDPPAP